MGSIVSEVPKGWTSTLLVYSARERGYDQLMTLLVESGASHFFCETLGSKNNPASYESLCQDVKREEATDHLADCGLIKSEGV